MAYKHAKEAFVADHPGSSIARVQAVSLVGCTSYLLYASLPARPSPVRDYLVLFLPLLLAQTVFADHPYALNAGIAGTALLARILRPRQPTRSDTAPPRYPPFLTTWRAHMMCMTIIAILAVDFPIFPREFAKTEDWGTSLMDVGVGSFVFSQGLAASSRRPPLGKTVKKCLPVIALGMIRVIMVKNVDYPEHVTEYGVHWNFFFTLAAMPTLAALLGPLRRLPGSVVLLLLLLAHTAALRAGLEAWVMAPDATSRTGTGLLHQNKEGITSLPGYLAIYLIGSEIGRIVLPPPSGTERRTRMPRRLAAWAGGSWTVLFLLRALRIPVSRRLTNAPYVVWTTGFNTTFLLGYYLIERYAFPPSRGGAGGGEKVPPLLQAINKNGLVLFLLANLLTGLINVSLETMYASHPVALGVLLVYTGVLSGVAWGLRGMRVMF